MTDYGQIWGKAPKDWCNINFREKQISSALLVAAWMGMIAFVIFGIFSMVTRSDWAAILMIASILTWVGSGIAIVRVRRTQRKLLMLRK